jgi:hypothetical protein
MKLLSAVVAILSAGLFAPASFARMNGNCAKIVDAAALRAVERIPVIGQTTAFGSPFAIEPDVLRVEVDVFGPQTQIYAVDVTVDSECNVLATSTRLESEQEAPR